MLQHEEENGWPYLLYTDCSKTSISLGDCLHCRWERNLPSKHWDQYLARGRKDQHSRDTARPRSPRYTRFCAVNSIPGVSQNDCTPSILVSHQNQQNFCQRDECENEPESHMLCNMKKVPSIFLFNCPERTTARRAKCPHEHTWKDCTLNCRLQNLLQPSISAKQW